MSTIGTHDREQRDDGDVGDGEDRRDHEHDREEAADEDRVDRERAGPVARLPLEVQAAPRAVVAPS